MRDESCPLAPWCRSWKSSDDPGGHCDCGDVLLFADSELIKHSKLYTRILVWLHEYYRNTWNLLVVCSSTMVMNRKTKTVIIRIPYEVIFPYLAAQKILGGDCMTYLASSTVVVRRCIVLDNIISQEGDHFSDPVEARLDRPLRPQDSLSNAVYFWSLHTKSQFSSFRS